MLSSYLEPVRRGREVHREAEEPHDLWRRDRSHVQHAKEVWPNARDNEAAWRNLTGGTAGWSGRLWPANPAHSLASHSLPD